MESADVDEIEVGRELDLHDELSTWLHQHVNVLY